MMDSCPTMLQERSLENFLLGMSYTKLEKEIVFFNLGHIKVLTQGVINSVHML